MFFNLYVLLFLFLRVQMLDLVKPVGKITEKPPLAHIEAKILSLLSFLRAGWASASWKVIVTNSKRMSGLDQPMSRFFLVLCFFCVLGFFFDDFEIKPKYFY